MVFIPTVPLAPGITREFLLHHRVCPVRFDATGSLEVAVEDESVLDGLDDLAIAYEVSLVPNLVGAEQVRLLIERLTTGENHDVEYQVGADHPSDGSDIRDLANQPPVVRYVNLLIRDAAEIGASDIHLESTAEGLSARLRLDGVLVPALQPPAHMEQPVLSRIKLLADLDIANSRRPQDGRMRLRLDDRVLDVRVSTVPTIHGESAVLRLLDRTDQGVSGLAELGLDDAMLADLRALAQRPHGMLLVTGPTGSGKTTTLYAALALRDAVREKILTVEDPVEHAVPGVIQVPIHTQNDLSFAGVLRSLLRQDPDVLMVGEMRDEETAAIAMKAALTGHVVFSTLHTNDAVGAITRLFDMGIPPYVIAATLQAVLAQRLVRRLCTSCRRPIADVFEMGAGCDNCRGTSYRGRTGVFELLKITPEIRSAIAAATSYDELRRLAVNAGMVPLGESAMEKVRSGETSMEEVLRVIEI